MDRETPNSLDHYWQQIEEIKDRQPTIHDTLLLDHRVGTQPVRLAMSADQVRSLLVPVGSLKEVRRDARSSGVQIDAATLRDAGGDAHFARMTCSAVHLNDLFNVLVLEVLDRIQVEPGAAASHCNDVLERWRELLGGSPSRLLTEERLRGLFGELTLLRLLAGINSRSLSLWSGPGGQPHDFESPIGDLEIKVCRPGLRRELQINGPLQLDNRESLPLHLVILKLAEADYGASVPDLVTSIIGQGVARHDFVSRLDKAGYRLEDAAAYEARRYSVAEQRVYRVTDTMPRIVPTSFGQGTVPQGVVSLTYTIDLSLDQPTALDQAAVDHLLQALAGSAG